MSQVAILIADMVRAGVDPELIGRTAEALAERAPAMDMQAERRRSKDRERKRLRNSAESAELKEDTPTPPEENTPPSPPKGGSSPRQRFADPAIILQSMLDPMTARAFVDHMAQRKPRLTEQSAEGVLAVLRRVKERGGDPVAAIRFSMAKGWGIFDVDWLKNAGFEFAAQAPPVAGFESLDRYADEALFAECERLMGKPVPSSMQRYSFPADIIQKAQHTGRAA